MAKIKKRRSRETIEIVSVEKKDEVLKFQSFRKQTEFIEFYTEIDEEVGPLVKLIVLGTLTPVIGAAIWALISGIF